MAAENTLDILMSDSPEVRYAKWLLRKAIPNGDCLECHLSNASRGYCKVKNDSVAHRYVYRHLVKDPGNLLVRHSCDNRRCINLDHLSLGTTTDNALDMVSRGRFVPSTGPGFGTKRLFNDEEHTEIHKLYAEDWTQRQIAELFKTSQCTIYRYLKTEVGKWPTSK